MPPEVLEDIFVQRQELAQQLVERIHKSVFTPVKHHTLLTGPRGIGKTHLVSLVYHRICNIKDLRERIFIAWLSEEEWSVTSFLDLLLCIFQALQEESKNSKGAQPYPPTERVESLYKLPIEAAESDGAALLKAFIANHTLLLLVENLDDLFSGLGKDGQKQLRTFLEENNCIIVATAQSYFKDIKQKNSPFYGFFQHEELQDLNTDEATQLLANIAKHNKNSKLELFIQTPTGRERIKAVHFLAGGNHRLYVIFSEFLTHQESLDQLVDAFMRTLDDLTPYYQERMRYLSPQQRKIIDFLCDRRQAVTVKEIAQRCFMTHQTASSQLKKLLEMGYVRSEPIGRESYYDLRELLMRFCLEVKKQRGEPIRLFVDFLRLWYTRTELQERLGLGITKNRNSWESDGSGQPLSAGSLGELAQERNYPMHQHHLEALPSDSVLHREYLLYALQATKEDDEDPRVAAYRQEYEEYYQKKDYVYALQLANKLVAIRGQAQDWLAQGSCLTNLKRYEQALASFNEAVELDPNSANGWLGRGLALCRLERYEQALVSLEKVIELDLNNALVWFGRGTLLYYLQRYEEALASYDKAIELNQNYVSAWFSRGELLERLKRYEAALASFDQGIKLDCSNARAWGKRGWVLKNLQRNEEALESFDKAIDLNPDDAWVRCSRGIILDNLKRNEEALTSLEKAIQLIPNYAGAWAYRGLVLNKLERYEEALASFDKVIELDSNYAAWAWGDRGNVLDKLERDEEALASFDKAIELDSDDAWAWSQRGDVFNKLKRYEEALASYDKAIELDFNYAWVWGQRGDVLNKLERYQEALASLEKAYDKAIELYPDLAWAWANRGWLLNQLERYQEAFTSYDKAIELNPDDVWAWRMRGTSLVNLRHYEEALKSYEQAIALGEQSSDLFFKYGIALLGLNRWDESINALDDALNGCLADEEEIDADDTALIIRNLFNNTNDAEMWRSRLKTLIELYYKHKVLSALGQGLVRSIPALMSEMVSDKAAQIWLELWQELTSDYIEFQIPLRLLNAAVRYRETKGDKRVLLELPIEERKLLQQVLEME